MREASTWFDIELRAPNGIVQTSKVHEAIECIVTHPNVMTVRVFEQLGGDHDCLRLVLGFGRVEDSTEFIDDHTVDECVQVLDQSLDEVSTALWRQSAIALSGTSINLIGGDSCDC